MARRQNVLFILIDQLRADLLHGALADHARLPNLRLLMDEAVSFRRHYSVCNPCGPSRASILTGQYAMNHRSVRNGTPLRHDTPNIAREARRLGRLPLLFGYSDTSLDPRVHDPNDPALRTYEGVMPGFEEVIEMRLEQSLPWRAHLAARGYDLPDYSRFYEPQAAPGQPRRLNDPAFYWAEDSDTAFLTDAFLNNLQTRKDRPWFTHLTYIRPHPPFVAPAPYNDMHDPAVLPLPEAPQTGCMDHPFLKVCARVQRAIRTVDGFDALDETPENIQALRATYLGLAAEVDHHIGRVIGFLKDTGQYDDTLIVIGADHGEMLGDFGIWGKMSVFDAAYHVPLVIRDPYQPGAHGTAVDAFTESVDVMPTILDWLGGTPPSAVNGASLMSFLSGNSPENWRDTSYSELAFGDPVTPTAWQEELGLTEAESSLAILRKDNLTLTHFSGALPPILFDHATDGERANLAGDPSRAGDLLAMTQALLGHRMRFPDSTLSKTMLTEAGPVTGS
ncbi:sulfatase-like hydrolase/transferase [Roseovarius sp. CAU 1744]|uniref:sulfatase-like hydrolase/transferase n=1 Tax=Roseovarius sp. CAU 1744 TaxID=3140368 RepID=UPI00325A513E